jgi:hypothetical protein
LVTAASEGFSIPALSSSARTARRPASVLAEHDRVRAAQDAEQRPPAAAIVRGALDQARDLDELHRHAADPRHCRHRPRRREGVVAGSDLDA